MENIKLNIANEYTKTPGARYITDGKFSGEDFYNTLLESKYKKALEENKKLEIDFDGTLGAPSSFLSEAFGRLYKNYGEGKIWEKLLIISSDDSSLEGIIKKLAEKYE